MMQAEFRHRLMNGAYAIRAAGLYQLDKDEFMRSDGDADAGLSRLARRGRIERPVFAQPALGLGLGRRC